MDLAEALSAKKTRLVGDFLLSGLSAARVQEQVWVALRARTPLPGISQDETLKILQATPTEGGYALEVEVASDRDFNSQYDASDTWRLQVTVFP